ncbi:MAG: hypothetical protein Ct9H300mP25_13440 [Acidobacteriota bacterium]|nr:MAG: hypothetical protein Ct9H300mP25_13440 [Acidobacteriota bacterium]
MPITTTVVERGLPVLRAKYDDLDQTGSILILFEARSPKGRTTDKVEPLVYHGLHSLDFPFLYYRRPLWDIVVIGLSVGGIVLNATTLLPAWRRVRRHVERYLVSC